MTDSNAPFEKSFNGRLTNALEQYLLLLEKDEVPDEREFLAKFPKELRDELAECIAGLAFVEQLAPNLRGDGKSVDATSAAGSLVSRELGDYRIIREIGRGGMGIVYEAEQLSLARKVALKVLPFASLLDDRQLQRFKNEARAVASLRHPNIVQVHGVGNERSVHFYAMDLIEGHDLSEVIQQIHGMNSLPESSSAKETKTIARLSTQHSSSRSDFYRSVARLGIQVANALQFAHEEGVTHRDIKPANLLLDQNGEIHIADFGLARVQSQEDLTLTGDRLGTLRYMSPEQLSDEKLVDQRTDIYSLGLSLYELSAGRPAFDEPNHGRLSKSILEENPPSLRSLTSDVPQDLETVLLRAISKHPDSRYSTAQDFAADLQRFIEYRPIVARRPSILRNASQWCVRNRVVALASLITLLALTSGLSFSILGWREAAIAQKSLAQQNFVANTYLAYESWKRGDLTNTRHHLRLATESPHVDARKDEFPWALLDCKLQQAEALPVITTAASPQQILFSQNRHFLYVVDPETISKWSTTNRQLVWQKGINEAPWRSLSLASDSRLVVNSRDHIHVHDANNGQEITKIDCDFGVNIFNFVIREQHLFVHTSEGAGGRNGTFMQTTVNWDDGSLLEPWVPIKLHGKEDVVGFDISLDGSRVVTAQRSDNSIWIRSPEWVPLYRIGDSQIPNHHLKFSVSGTYVVSSPGNVSPGDLPPIVWDIEEKATSHRWRTFRTGTELLIAPDEELAVIYAGFSNGAVHFFRPDLSRPILLRGHSSKVIASAWSSDSTMLATASSDGEIRLWTPTVTPTNTDITFLRSLTIADNQTAFITREDTKYRGQAGEIERFDISSKRVRDRIITKGLPTGVTYDKSNGRLFCSEAKAFPEVWSRDNQFNSAVGIPSEHWSSEVAVSPTGKLLAIGKYGATDVTASWVVELWALQNDTWTKSWSGEHPFWPISIAFSNDEQCVAVGDWFGTLKVWDSQTGDEIWSKNHDCQVQVWTIAFAPDTSTLVSGAGDGTIRFWNPRTGEEVRPRIQGKGEVFAVAFSPDGKILAYSNANGSVSLLDVATNQMLGELDMRTSVRALQFTPNGRSLVCALSDGTNEVLFCEDASAP